MWQKVESEKRIADHLLYVSLKYTKTCDVMLNLIARWQVMIEESINSLLDKMKKKRDISSIPAAPKLKINILLKEFKKNKEVNEVLELYGFFRKINQFQHIKEQEFRKNVTLRVIDAGKVTEINIDKLKEWESLLERFLSFVRHYIK